MVVLVTCLRTMLSAEEAADSDEEVQTPVMEEQIEFLILLVERLMSRVLRAPQENTDSPPSTDLAAADRRGGCNLSPVPWQGAHMDRSASFLTGVQSADRRTTEGGAAHFHNTGEEKGSLLQACTV